MKRKKLKKILYVLFSLFLFDRYAYPLIHYSIPSIYVKKAIKSKKIQKLCKTDLYLKFLKDDLKTPLSVLKLAHLVTAKYLTYVPHIDFPFKERRDAFEKGEADCSFYSIFVYSNYLYIVEKLGLNHLKDKVRLVTGYVSTEDVSGAHRWVEYKEDGAWKVYETTDDIFESCEFLCPSKKSIEEELKLVENLNEGNYYGLTYIHFKNGELKRGANLKNIIFNKKGLAQLVIETLKNRDY